MMTEVTKEEAERSEEADLSPRTRLALFHGSATSVERALSVDMSSVSVAELRSMGVTADNLRATGMKTALLNSIGIRSAEDMRTMGIDALDLDDVGFCSQCVAKYGAAEVRRCFLVNASDGVALAGTQASHMLGVTPLQLLEASAGDPLAAKTVLQQLPPQSLGGVDLDTLMNTGIQMPALTECGYGFAYIVKHYKPTPTQASLMGMQKRPQG